MPPPKDIMSPGKDPANVDPRNSDISRDEIITMAELVAQRIFGYTSYERATGVERTRIRMFLDEFYAIAADPEGLINDIKNNRINATQRRVLQYIVDDPTLVNDFARLYLESTVTSDQRSKSNFPGDHYGTDDEIFSDNKTAGAALQLALNKYIEWAQNNPSARLDKKFGDAEDYLEAQVKKFGDFKTLFDHLDVNKRIRELTIDRPGKFRRDTPPKTIQTHQCRIGLSTFLVPPTNIRVSQVFKTGSISEGALRQPNTPKTNLGYSETQIEMNLFFPNHESIWGFRGHRADFNIFNWDPDPERRPDTSDIQGNEIQQSGQQVSDEVIDYFLSSLRGLITQFKYAPFLPIRNEYLNKTYDITAVSMLGMTVSTVPEYPFVIQVNLRMAKFNFNPYLPMLDDFNSALHWGRFRQYLGKAAARLDAQVNQGFLLAKSDKWTYDPTRSKIVPVETPTYEGALIPVFDKVKDLEDGRFFEFYYPITTPSRIFAPDTTDWRQPGEDEQPSVDRWDGILSSLGLDIIEDAPKFNFFEFDKAIKAKTQERELLYEWLRVNSQVWQNMNNAAFNKYLEEMLQKGLDEGSIKPDNIDLARKTFTYEWFYALFDLFTSNNKAIQKLIDNRDYKDSDYTLNEWKIPMEQMVIDWDHCIVNGISVNLSNQIVPHQIQLQEEPTHQHIGGGDSSVYVSMTIIGEDNLIRLRRMFQHINGLARLEAKHGVLGFLGIKNVLTALCGIKYVLPLAFEVETKPGFPRVYEVNMSFVDFDVMQQQRESLNSSQQAEMIEHFGKRNPFLRVKQFWQNSNLYPDLPLDLRDKSGNLVGHLDPDWYFRSFKNSDEDLFYWDEDAKVMNLIKTYDELKAALDPKKLQGTSPTAIGQAVQRAKEIEAELKELHGAGAEFPPGWRIVDGQLKAPETDDDFGQPELRQILGAYGENDESTAVIDFFPGGYLNFGEIGKDGKVSYKYRMAQFNEDLASDNYKAVEPITNTVGLDQSQNPYLPNVQNPNQQFQTLLQDFHYRNLQGRMLRAFPTYMLWLIDEGGRFAGIKLFDNFYGLNSIIDFSVLQSEDSIGDTLIMRVSNIYKKLTSPYNDVIIREDDPLYETPIGRWMVAAQSRKRNLDSGLFSYTEEGDPNIIDIGSIRLKPGVRVHLRAGYGSNPNSLETIFNGTITEVGAGDIMTIVAQSDAIELNALVNSTSVKGHSGKVDGGMLSNFYLSEPRDLMVRLLSMGSSRFREWLAWGSKGVIFSESRFGIRHFGNILYEEMTDNEYVGTQNMTAALVNKIQNSSYSGASANQFRGMLGETVEDLSNVSASSMLPWNWNQNLIAIGQMLWFNQASKRDYEIYKRNIYPGNGTGVAQFMGGDMVDAGIIITTATAWYDNETGSPSTESDTVSTGSLDQVVKNTTETGGNESSKNPIDTDNNKVDLNRELIDVINRGEAPLNNEELQALFEDRNTADALDFDINGPTNNWGLFDWIVGGIDKVNDAKLDILNFTLDNTLFAWEKLGPFGTITWARHQALSLGDPVNRATSIYQLMRNPAAKLGLSGVGQALGLIQEVGDDDLYGYDEVAFRAQTYMKTVWDLFKICAALLPNYVVAIRPFEDRSTVFYGKPHWLYTSGVIPITAGLPRDREQRPKFVDPDEIMADLLNQANRSTSQNLEQLMRVADQTNALKDVFSFAVGANVDPYDAGRQMEDAIKPKRSEEGVQYHIETFKDDDEELYDHYKSWLQDPVILATTYEEMEAIFGALKERGIDNAYTREEFDKVVQEQIQAIEDSKFKNAGDAQAAKEFFDYLIAADIDPSTGSDRFNAQLEALVGQDPKKKQAVIDLFNNDPITFAYQFGWAFTFVPAYIDPETGFGHDNVGHLAKAHWDAVDERSSSDATDIWRDFRITFPEDDKVREIYNQVYPLTDSQSKFDSVMQTFMRFMWQDPYNRSWLVNAAERVPNFDLKGRDWNWTNIYEAWRQFLVAGDTTIDENGTIQSPLVRRYMRNNRIVGDSASNPVTALFEDVSNWWDNNVGQVFGLIVDSITGIVDSIRLSLAQMGAAMSLAGLQQQQANALNAIFNNSRYYQAGAPGSLERLCDNPFTREYGEPVIEIREPFQRVHFVSSFDAIISNGIRESLTDVATVVTAVSDGKNPVTVHFDKGIPPDRQVEMTVETGIYWDNVFGSGLSGILQPLIHPFEALRGVTKTRMNSSDELTSRRIALWHLKKSIQQIYDGEIIIQGRADIRPYDLLFIADAREKMYGFVECAQVIHHFTPENGFITSISPNPVVTINDPVNWSFISYLWGKMASYNLRSDVRAAMGVKAERELVQATKEITDRDIYKHFSTQIHGAMQYTQGNNALARDFGAIYAAGGMHGLTQRDEIFNQIHKINISLGAFKAGATIGGGVLGALGGNPVSVGVGAVAGYGIGELAWSAWQWVKENLLDQQGLYVQYLNKDGEPMDAGLGHYRGVAAGTNHVINLFPSILGINSPRSAVIKDGHYRITTNDLLAAIGWTEVDTISLYRDTSIYVNQINSRILDISGRDSVSLNPGDGYIILRARVLDPAGESTSIGPRRGVVDGDTLWVQILNGPGNTPGAYTSVRLANVNTWELETKDDPSLSPANDLGRLATEYMMAKFDNQADRYIAIRVKADDQRDNYDRLVGTIFHNAPFGTSISDRLEILEGYASRSPAIPWDAYLNDGRPYTLNWEMIMTGYGNVDMRESLWNTSWRDGAIEYGRT